MNPDYNNYLKEVPHKDTVELKAKVDSYKKREDYALKEYLLRCVPKKNRLKNLAHMTTIDYLMIYKFLSTKHCFNSP